MKLRLSSMSGVLLALTLMFYGLAPAAGGDKQTVKKISTPTGTPVRTYLNINNISTVFKNTGISDIDAQESNSGLVFPKGSRKTAVYESGFLWGGNVGGEVRVGGSAYREGMQPGKILSPGLAEDPDLAKNRIYRVRPDEKPGSGSGFDANLSSEVADEGLSEAAVRAQYETDWMEWPAGDGAPYDDVDNNGSYDPSIDIPGVPGADQTIWYVANDLDPNLTTNLYGSNPIGIEMQVTVWAYSQQGALGNMFFRKYVIINKSVNNIDSMYVSMWSDIDLGNSTDDFAGCDTTLSLGYCYNAFANDATYNPLPPPAVGFDFFQGPLVDAPGETGISNGMVIPDKRNLPMTAFYYFARGDAAVTDPTQGSYEGTQQFYNFFQGKIGRTGVSFEDPNTNQPTPFALAGDPQTRTGWVDGDLLPSGDRRIGLASGPFTMAAGDTQEVVVAEICAGAIEGVDRISAIGLLKFYDKLAQQLYDNFFNVIPPPPPPVVSTEALNREIVLSWGDDQQAVEATEGFDQGGYTFEGYNVYQLPSISASISAAKRIATFDIVNGVGKIIDDEFDQSKGEVLPTVVQSGNDTKIKRFMSISNDEIRGGVPLVNGTAYYFAVTAYSYSPDPLATPKTKENPLVILSVTPHSEDPGVRYPGGVFGDEIEVTHNVPAGFGSSDGNVVVTVVEPNKLTGLEYKVVFDTSGGETVWHILRYNANNTVDTLVRNGTDQTGAESSPIVDGMQVKVFGPALDFKRFSMIANADGPVSGDVGYDITPSPATNVPPFEGYSADWYRDVLQGDASILDLDAMQVAGGFMFIVAGGSNIGDHTSAIGRWTRNGDNWPLIIPNDYEIRFTAAGGKAVWPSEFGQTGATADVPFEIWYTGVGTVNDPSDDVRMIPVILDEADDGVWGFQLDHEASGGNNDPYSDWIYFYMPADETPGSSGYEAAVAANPTTRDPGWHEHIARLIIMNWNQLQSGGAVDALPEEGTVFRIESSKPNKAGVDEFAFRSTAPTFNNGIAQTDIDEINVFPNPYYGVNPQELNKYQRFVTFNHLPERATIRIINLAGVVVKTIEKTAPGQFQRWDLTNESGLPVASGLYIAYIDMPEVGTTKIVKLSIIQERQILDRF